MNIEKIKAILPPQARDDLDECMQRYQINTVERLAHFLAQCGHESGGFVHTMENLNYSAEVLRRVFGKYFKGEREGFGVSALDYARNPQKIASRVYANRMGNGDEASGDGWRYRGRGFIQLTGKDNYAAFNSDVNDDILEHPDLVANKYPLASAGWFWNKNNLNRIADEDDGENSVMRVTRVVNGGFNGLEHRTSLYHKYKELLQS